MPGHELRDTTESTYVGREVVNFTDQQPEADAAQLPESEPEALPAPPTVARTQSEMAAAEPEVGHTVRPARDAEPAEHPDRPHSGETASVQDEVVVDNRNPAEAYQAAPVENDGADPAIDLTEHEKHAANASQPLDMVDKGETVVQNAEVVEYDPPADVTAAFEKVSAAVERRADLVPAEKRKVSGEEGGVDGATVDIITESLAYRHQAAAGGELSVRSETRDAGKAEVANRTDTIEESPSLADAIRTDPRVLDTRIAECIENPWGVMRELADAEKHLERDVFKPANNIVRENGDPKGRPLAVRGSERANSKDREKIYGNLGDALGKWRPEELGFAAEAGLTLWKPEELGLDPEIEYARHKDTAKYLRKAAKNIPYPTAHLWFHNLSLPRSLISGNNADIGADKTLEELFETRITRMNDAMYSRYGKPISPGTLPRAIALAAVTRRFMFDDGVASQVSADSAKAGTVHGEAPELERVTNPDDLTKLPDYLFVNAVTMTLDLANSRWDLIQRHREGELGSNHQKQPVPEEIHKLQAMELALTYWVARNHMTEEGAQRVLLNGIFALSQKRIKESAAGNHTTTFNEGIQGNVGDVSEDYIGHHIVMIAALSKIGKTLHIPQPEIRQLVAAEKAKLLTTISARNPDAARNGDFVIGMPLDYYNAMDKDKLQRHEGLLEDYINKTYLSYPGGVVDTSDEMYKRLQIVQERLASFEVTGDERHGDQKGIIAGRAAREDAREHPPQDVIHFHAGRGGYGAEPYAALIAVNGGGPGGFGELTTQGLAMTPAVRRFLGDLSEDNNAEGQNTKFREQDPSPSIRDVRWANIIPGKVAVGTTPRQLMDQTLAFFTIRDIPPNREFLNDLELELGRDTVPQFTLIPFSSTTVTFNPVTRKPNQAMTIWAIRNNPDGTLSDLGQFVARRSPVIAAVMERQMLRQQISG